MAGAAHRRAALAANSGRMDARGTRKRAETDIVGEGKPNHGTSLVLAAVPAAAGGALSRSAFVRSACSQVDLRSKSLRTD